MWELKNSVGSAVYWITDDDYIRTIKWRRTSRHGMRTSKRRARLWFFFFQYPKELCGTVFLYIYINSENRRIHKIKRRDIIFNCIYYTHFRVYYTTNIKITVENEKQRKELTRKLVYNIYIYNNWKRLFFFLYIYIN